MTNCLHPGDKGVSISDGLIVLRLAKPAMDSLESHKAHESHFSLSTADEQSDLKSLSVWVKDLTPAEKAHEFLEINKAAYCLALYLNVDNIRIIRIFTDFPKPPLDVVWDPDDRPGAEGHAGIVGLMRPPGGERLKYKALRAKLAQIATVEILPNIIA